MDEIIYKAILILLSTTTLAIIFQFTYMMHMIIMSKNIGINFKLRIFKKKHFIYAMYVNHPAEELHLPVIFRNVGIKFFIGFKNFDNDKG